MKEKFTKGEWVGQKDGEWFSGNASWSLDCYDCEDFSYVEIGCGDETVAIVPMKGWNDTELDGNAHLIAAAPEMYKMLEKILDECNDYQKRTGNKVTWSEDASKLLVKARGE